MRTLAALGLWAITAATAQAASDGLEPLRDLRDYAVGFRTTCAVTNAGGLWCWGGSPEGQVGDGDTIDRNTPVPVLGLESGVQRVATGRRHTCAILDAGTVKCWGDNLSGTLGLGSSTNERRLSPGDPVLNVSGASQLRTSGLGRGTCALTSSGSVWCWGSPYGSSPSQIQDGAGGALSGVAQIATSTQASCARLLDGGLKCWGSGFSGEFGIDPSGGAAQPAAQAVPGLLDVGVTVQDIAGGDRFFCALLSSDEVRCWGLSVEGSLGRGDSTTANYVPEAVQGLPAGTSGGRLALGRLNGCLEYNDGRVYCWGNNDVGEFGDGNTTASTTARLVRPTRTDLRGLVSSHAHSCAVDASGGLHCWGRSDTGMLGTAATTDKLFPQRVTVVPTALGIGLGENHTCAMLAGGEARCWGANYDGQLAREDLRSEAQPMPITGLAAGVIEIEGGFSYGCARNSDRQVFCWGGNDSGQLGVGSSESTLFSAQGPLALSGPAVDLDTGYLHACAVIEGGAVQCWGENESCPAGDCSAEAWGGQLGNAVPVGTDSNVPVTVGGLPAPATQVAAGQLHTCARLSNGQVACWGDNQILQLARDFSTQFSADPLLVPGISTAVEVSSGPFHSCARLADGGVKCWGQNSFAGELGDGTQVDSFTPVSVVGLPGPAESLQSGGTNVTCARVGSEAYCWGWNLHGPIGDGSSKPRSTATLVALQGIDVVDVKSGGLHTCALSSLGETYCWGWNIYGQIGTGDYSFSTTPQPVLIDAAARSVEAVSDSNGGGSNEEEQEPVSSGNGEFVVYTAREVTAGKGSGPRRLLRRNLQTGAVQPVNVDTLGNPLAGDALEASSSANGQLIVFVAPKPGSGKSSAIRGVWPKAGSSSPNGLFLRNMQTGSTTALGNAKPLAEGTKPTISADGSTVVYTRPADPGEGSPGALNVFSIPLVPAGGGEVSPGLTRCQTCKTLTDDGQPSGADSVGDSENPVLSADGQWLAFQTTSNNLLSGQAPCPTASSAILLRNIQTGQTRRISNPQTGGSCGSGGAVKPSIDYSGQNIVFVSAQPLTGSDNNAGSDAYLFNPSRGLRQISLGEQGSAIGEVDTPVISGNGRTVAFVSTAANLDASEPDNNDANDIYVQRLQDQRTLRLAKNRRGSQVSSASRRPSLDYSGTGIAFDSAASNVLDGAVEGISGVYKRRNALSTDYIYSGDFE